MMFRSTWPGQVACPLWKKKWKFFCRASWVGLSNIPKVGVWKRASNLCNVQAVEPSIWKGNMKEGSPNNTKTISKSLTRIGQFPACSAAHSHCKSDSTNFPGVLPVDCLHLTFQFEGRRSSRSPSSMVPSSLESTSMQRRDQGCSAHASSELLLRLLRLYPPVQSPVKRRMLFQKT